MLPALRRLKSVSRPSDGVPERRAGIQGKTAAQPANAPRAIRVKHAASGLKRLLKRLRRFFALGPGARSAPAALCLAGTRRAAPDIIPAVRRLKSVSRPSDGVPERRAGIQGKSGGAGERAPRLSCEAPRVWIEAGIEAPAAVFALGPGARSAPAALHLAGTREGAPAIIPALRRLKAISRPSDGVPERRAGIQGNTAAQPANAPRAFR
ncbi:hypothetical protein [Roseixanthobacter liquoris]|uniref:hypothetical protein n=1 Tax=Roseixanthobacter liquoris TaxID=3119921 RepID=UPI003727C435